MYKVMRTFKFQEGVTLEQEVLKGVAEVIEAPCHTEDDILEKCRDADAIICGYEPYTKRVLDNLPNLKHLAFKTIGFNFADIEAAKANGIAVSHITQYCTLEVADYVTGVLLMLNRRIPQFDRDVHVNKQWNYELFPEMRRFSEMTVGFLGFGNIPRLIAKRLKPFGIRMIACDPYIKPQTAADMGVELADFDQVLAAADYLSLHMPLNPSTEKIINRDVFAKMKDGSFFINAARGALVDEGALIEALDSKKIKMYVADVVSDEFPDMNVHPFASRGDIILTPHIAWYSQESLRDGRIEAANHVLSFFKGEYDKCEIVNGVLQSR